MIKIGSLFSGIGCFELGLERAIADSTTIWQVEQDTFCQKVLQKHWPQAQIFDDVRTVGKHNLEPVDIICGGFPCTDISIANIQKRGLHGQRSGLWWEMHRIILELSEGPKKPIVVLENVPNIIRMGGREVLGSLAELGYDTEWGIISAGGPQVSTGSPQGFGAPHIRKRWFCVAYPNGQHGKGDTINPKRVESREGFKRPRGKNGRIYIENHWEKTEAPPRFCNLDDGITHRLAKLRALGNTIVPQCSQYIGEYIVRAGIL